MKRTLQQFFTYWKHTFAASHLFTLSFFVTVPLGIQERQYEGITWYIVQMVFYWLILNFGMLCLIFGLWWKYRRNETTA